MSDELAAAIENAVYDGPMACYGFRSGLWPFTFRGHEYQVYLSIPSRLDLAEQQARLLAAARAELGKLGVL